MPSLKDYEAVVAICPDQLEASSFRRAGFPIVRRWAVLPSWDDPRWFVPLASPAVASATFSLYAPFRRSAKFKRFGIRLLARSGLPGWYRDEVLIAQRSESPLYELAAQVVPSNPIQLAISTGTPGPTRKPTLMVLEDGGDVHAVMKIADTPVTHNLLRREAHALRALSGATTGDSIAPKLLLESMFDSRLVTIQSVLPGRAAQADFDHAQERFLTRLQMPASKSARSSTIIQSFPARMSAVQEPGLSLEPIRNEISRLLGDATVPETIVHGDFAPWNLRQERNKVAAFDWEFAELNGLPLLDELHFRFQTGFLLRNWRVSDALAMMWTQRVNGHPYLTESNIHGIQLVYWLHTLLQRYEFGYPRSDEQLLRAERVLAALVSQAEGSR